MNRLRIIVICSLLCTFAFLALPGCQSVPALRESRAWHGRTPVYATYRFGLLHTELPPGHSIEVVMVTARSVLYRQGHTIEEASVTPEGGRLVALAPSQSTYDKIKITTSFEGGGILMTINVDPAEENRARVVLESILLELGL
ncbi:MAG: hypothetical protein P1U42_00450 [Phycisphaerales bacterium]|jgi:hypothetical protein|nr:hypothetical protein [Phycisphaerales bacterium]